ncbi:MAG: hypothetical protein PHH83_02600, partial [Patescibacteria group bacterium]|nr:hypothetical protein [Patescibacteria group bacterium]
SKSNDNSNIAFYGAESGNEQAIYYLRQKPEIEIEDLNIVEPRYMSGSETRDAKIIRNVSTTSPSINIGLKKNDFFQFDMFNNENFSEGSDLSYLEISWEDNCSTEESPNSSWIELTSNQWSSSDGNVNWGEMAHHVFKSLLNRPPYSGDSAIRGVGGSDFDPDQIYQFRIKALFCDIYNLTVKAFYKNPETENPEQLLFKNLYVIKTVAQYPGDSLNGNKQALSVVLRNRDPLSGLFDYVIFSEQALIKD